MFELAKPGLATPRMIRPIDLNDVGLFRFFVTTRMKIGDKIIDFRFLQNVGEGWHLMTALKYLCAYLIFAQRAAHTGEVRSLGAAVFADGVAVLAAVVSKDRGSMALIG
jgi:hypothetical protein